MTETDRLQTTDWKAEAALWKKEFDDARDHYEGILSEQDAEVKRLQARVAELERELSSLDRQADEAIDLLRAQLDEERRIVKAMERGLDR